MVFWTAASVPSDLTTMTPRHAIGTDPTQSHLTSARFTVPRRRWTIEPTGFITAAATRSDDTAVSGGMPKTEDEDGSHQRSTAHACQADDDADPEGGCDQEPVDGHGFPVSSQPPLAR